MSTNEDEKARTVSGYTLEHVWTEADAKEAEDVAADLRDGLALAMKRLEIYHSALLDISKHTRGDCEGITPRDCLDEIREICRVTIERLR